MTTDERASAVESAKALKATLQAAYPATRFSVTLGRGTAYGWGRGRVAWSDGPTVARVDAIANAFEGQGFDGMTDSTYTKNGRLPDGRRTGLRGINTERRLSPAFVSRLVKAIAAFWGGPVVLPDVTTNSYGGWSLEPSTMYNAMIRPDLDINWSDAIHRAARDREQVTR